MSNEWTSYLKKAVATAESRFDQLLEETSQGSQSSQSHPTPASSTPDLAKDAKATPSPRLSMQERLRGAVSSSPRSSGELERETDSDSIIKDDSSGIEEVEKLDTPPADLNRSTTPDLKVSQESIPVTSAASDSDLLSKLQAENAIMAEQLDSLQSKVVLLAGLEAERTKNSPPNAKKLADKDKQIALLIEEGTNLSKKELTHMNTIKKLRVKLKQGETLQEGFDKIKTRQDKELGSVKEKLKSKESELMSLKEEVKILKKNVSQSEKSDNPELRVELEDLKKSRDDFKKKHAELSNDLTEAKRSRDAMQKSRENLQTSHTALKEAHDQLKNTLNTASLSSQTLIADLKLEVSRLEARVEHYRGLNEEATARNSDQNTAKLLNQIENLNSQHSHSQDNWRSVELMLQGKISKLEEEVEECKSREAAVMKKNKALQNDLRTEREEIATLQDELGSVNELVFKSKRQVETLREELKECLANEKDESQVQMPVSVPPVAEARSSEEVEKLTLKIAALEEQLEERNMRLAARDEADMAVTSPLEGESPFGGVPTSPSDTYDRSFSYDRSFGSFERLQDVDQLTELDSRRSGTGPSIQVIGRMSSQVRKLTSEVSNLKEELVRVGGEKDEASREVVRLMTENDDLLDSKTKLATMEERLDAMEKRESQALEMLGEKEEKINELRADIADMKELYSRQISDLVDQLVEAKK
ncbi:Protein SGM1 [Yarrowia sp. E02]|nr:Protein SGM1 [Yarrowia sp. E02]